MLLSGDRTFDRSDLEILDIRSNSPWLSLTLEQLQINIDEFSWSSMKINCKDNTIWKRKYNFIKLDGIFLQNKFYTI